MTGDRGFRTGSGIARVRGGDLVVERSPRALLAGWYDRNVASASRARAVWNVLGSLMTVGTFWRFGWMLRDGVQSGVIEYLAVLVVVLLPVALAVYLYREGLRTTSVPLGDVDRAVVDSTERTLTLHHDDDETEVDLRGDDDVDTARERLRMRGVEVAEADAETDRDDEWRPWLEDEEGMPWPDEEGGMPSAVEGEGMPSADEESSPERAREREGEGSASGGR